MKYNIINSLPCRQKSFAVAALLGFVLSVVLRHSGLDSVFNFGEAVPVSICALRLVSSIVLLWLMRCGLRQACGAFANTSLVLLIVASATTVGLALSVFNPLFLVVYYLLVFATICVQTFLAARLLSVIDGGLLMRFSIYAIISSAIVFVLFLIFVLYMLGIVSMTLSPDIIDLVSDVAYVVLACVLSLLLLRDHN